MLTVYWLWKCEKDKMKGFKMNVNAVSGVNLNVVNAGVNINQTKVMEKSITRFYDFTP